MVKILVDKSEYCNLYKTISQLKRQVSVLQSTLRLFKVQNQKYLEWKNNFIDFIDKKQNEMKFGKEYDENNKILLDLLNNEHKEYPFYTPETLSLSNELYSFSPKYYEILCKWMPFPAESYIKNYQEAQLRDIPKMLTDCSMVKEIINHYKTVINCKKSDKLTACLAVDALYFTPEVKIDENNIIQGFLFSDKEKSNLPKNLNQKFTKQPKLFEAFVSRYFKKIIKAGFVFQLQLYDATFPTCVIHIEPSIDGKSNQKIVDLLKFFRKELKDLNIIVKSFAFDGDNAYSQLHSNFYYSYIYSTIEKQTISFHASVIRAVCDFLHLIKRLRYRILGARIHGSFDLNSPFIDMSIIQKILVYLPTVVFDNNKYTKMHDKPPLALFSPRCFLDIFNKKLFVAAAFWFPICCGIFGMDFPNISRKLRSFFLECAFWFLVLYRKISDNSKTELNQKKRGEKIDLVFYDNSLLIEFTNTIYSQIQLLTIEKKFSFNSDSSMPLEHKFGHARVRACDVHTLGRFTKIIAKFQTFEMQADQIKIPGRSSFGQFVDDDDDGQNYKPNEIEIMNSASYQPLDIATSFLNLAGFNIEPKTDNNDEAYWFAAILDEFFDEEKAQKKTRRPFTWNKAFLGVGGASRAAKLIHTQGGSKIAINLNSKPKK